jgi:hypothetical protein
MRLTRFAFRVGTSCIYRTNSTPAPNSSRAPLIATDDPEATRYELQPGLDFSPLSEMGMAFESPIRYRSYMSDLVQFCKSCDGHSLHSPFTHHPGVLTSIALPSGTVVADSLAHHLRSQWMLHAMSDPCLFHATLFSASASIDRLLGRPNTTLTLYHQTWAIRLINERLAQTEPVLTYGTIGAVIPLLYSSVSIFWQDKICETDTHDGL